MTRRVELQEGGKTTRELNRGRTLIELQKMKYNFGRAVVKDHLEGQKYLSDNELRATIFEAEAKVESIKLVEQLRSGTLRQLSRDRLEERIRESELKHASLIKQAEETRILGQDTNRKEIAIAYIEEQAKINRELINYEMEEERANSIIHSAYYDALKEISLGGIDILKASDKKMFEFNVNGTYGEINLNIGVKE